MTWPTLSHCFFMKSLNLIQTSSNNSLFQIKIEKVCLEKMWIRSKNQTLQSGIICVLLVSCHLDVYIPRFKRIVNAPSECLKSKHDGWIPETCIRMHNVFNIVPFCKTWNYSNDIDHQLVYNRPLIHFFKFQAQGGGGWGGNSILLIYMLQNNEIYLESLITRTLIQHLPV